MFGTTRGKVIPLRESSIIHEGDRISDRTLETLRAAATRPFPSVSTTPRLPAMIPDEILEYFGWVFCQGGFLNLHMTFEQFLSVVAAVSPAALCPEYDASETIAAD
ncbi:MAG TPA: hypothetical protein VKV03_02720 [Candidatus Binataceae bacterium]|nr:hypothetical protein [Candidatus Binataceae bacterium]